MASPQRSSSLPGYAPQGPAAAMESYPPKSAGTAPRLERPSAAQWVLGGCILLSAVLSMCCLCLLLGNAPLVVRATIDSWVPAIALWSTSLPGTFGIERSTIGPSDSALKALGVLHVFVLLAQLAFVGARIAKHVGALADRHHSTRARQIRTTVTATYAVALVGLGAAWLLDHGVVRKAMTATSLAYTVFAFDYGRGSAVLPWCGALFVGSGILLAYERRRQALDRARLEATATVKADAEAPGRPVFVIEANQSLFLDPEETKAKPVPAV